MPAGQHWSEFQARVIKTFVSSWNPCNDKAADPSNRSAVTSYDESYALVRGASYYGGGSHEK
ncbi:hypothetical protein Selli1_28720 [Sellimonas catena]|uniref:Uncharacterized protein n=1 Tax=Sellimonas catena TaxID=2994035 RepID=A0A9W6C9N6_9FIRM|nr:hypothetical protein Selli1_28720 [Sellimonas catena]